MSEFPEGTRASDADNQDAVDRRSHWMQRNSRRKR